MVVNCSKKIRYRSTFLILIFTLISIHINAINFYSVNRLFGISMRQTYSVCKDNNGFIWISSKPGIIRLTNENHHIYSLPFESENVLTVKLVYENSKLIAYTFNGQIFIYDPVNDRFDLFFNLGNALNNIFLRIQNISIDDSGAYWIASSTKGDHTAVTVTRSIQPYLYLRPIPQGQLDGMEMTDAEKDAYQNPGYN